MLVKDFLKQTQDKMTKSLESAKREFNEVRTGRAHPGLIEGLHVNYYDTPTLLKTLASISAPDAKTIIIQPWDNSIIPELEKAITNSNLGAAPANDGKVVRLSFPPLSEERRQELKKVVKDMAEKTRVSLRTIRREVNEKIKKMHSDKEISEDESFKYQEEVQKLTDKHIKEIDALLEVKGKELTQF